MMNTLAQIFGIAAAALGIFSIQIKNNKGYYTAQALSGLCFFFNFFLLGAHTAAMLNLLNVIRGFGFVLEKNRKPYVTVAVSSVLYVIATVLTFDGYLSALVCAAQLICTVTMASKKPSVIRLGMLFVQVPVWLFHNIVTGSLGATVCELFNLVSIAVYFARVKFADKIAEKKHS